MHTRARRGRRLALAGAVALALPLVGASSASAATVTNVDGTLTYTAAEGFDNFIIFEQQGPDRVRVSNFTPGDPLVTSGCTEDSPGTVVTCDGVLRVAADGRDGSDLLSVSVGATIPLALEGGTGNDTLGGGDGADVLNGGDGDDRLGGAGGADVVDGGAGDDALVAGSSAFFLCGPPPQPVPDAGDVYRGGTGFDTLEFGATSFFPGCAPPPQPDQRITLDGVADDGEAGEGDDVQPDVEGVVGRNGRDEVLGTAAANVLNGGDGNDLLDGGAGNDVLTGGGGDDVLEARDGFADFVSCGEGADVADVDALDDVSADCETINRADVGNANDVPEDRAPAVRLTAPAPGAVLSPSAPSTISADATDDRGVTRVLFVVNGRTVCEDTAAPFTCPWQPTGDDVGRAQITAIAYDGAQQQAVDQRSVTVTRFTPTLTQRTGPARDTTAPFRFATRGRVVLPEGVAPAQGCAGVVAVTVKVGRKTISTRRVAVRRDCTYRSAVTFDSDERFGRVSRLKVSTRFTGNAVLKRGAAVKRFVRVR